MYLSFLIRQGSGCLGEQSAAELVSDLQYISAPANSIVLSPKYNPVFLSWLFDFWFFDFRKQWRKVKQMQPMWHCIFSSSLAIYLPLFNWNNAVRACFVSKVQPSFPCPGSAVPSQVWLFLFFFHFCSDMISGMVLWLPVLGKLICQKGGLVKLPCATIWAKS